ncbi:GNAT family N-acetyltransferase [Desulfobaculum bizertense]|uniref:GNAT family N-acetyltransferase n=1 Tax=Desulfobaculum bizertense TaxID=376490 RepID=UPI001F244FCB|nr:GNAT family N-acetyltransferase [Desulfobaculum bizertense]UIJ39403.1 GNAT family N-acetyltransferase [Desulfobaculum bizertense]
MSFTLHTMTEQEIPAARELVASVFLRCIAPDYSQTGQEQFFAFITPAALRQRFSAESVFFIARHNTQIIGLLEVQKGRHIALLFTHCDWHGKGVATALLNKAFTFTKDCTITVNSSPSAIPVYTRLGFRPTQDMQDIHGIRFVPMQKDL